MNIVTVSEDCFPQIGGIATHVEGLSGGLLRAGHRVHVITRRRDVPNIRNFHVRARRFEHHGIPTTAIPIVYSPRNVLRRAQLRTRFAAAAAWRIAVERAHVVTCHHYLDDPDIVGALRRWRPIVFTNHSSQFLAAMARGEHEMLRRRIAIADAVIAPSRELVAATVACGYPEGATFYVPNGVDPSAFRPDAGARARVCAAHGLDPALPLVLCARRPVEKNGVMYFVQALARLASGGARLSVLFAGLAPERQPDEGPYTTRLREAVLALPAGIDRRMLGGVPNDAMPELQAAADVGVLPSLVEATSIAGLEAMACGTPLIGTRVGGIPEIVRDGETGRLVPAADAEAFAAALDDVLGDATRRAAMGAAARAMVEREFTWDVIARRSVEIYDEVIAARAGGATLARSVRPARSPASARASVASSAAVTP